MKDRSTDRQPEQPMNQQTDRRPWGVIRKFYFQRYIWHTQLFSRATKIQPKSKSNKMILLGWQHHAFRYYRRGLVHTRNCSSFLVLGISFCCLLSLFETPISINKLVFLLGYICQKYLLIPVGIEITRWELVFQVDNRGKIEGRERNIV